MTSRMRQGYRYRYICGAESQRKGENLRLFLVTCSVDLLIEGGMSNCIPNLTFWRLTLKQDAHEEL
jgi:hypothetical protein